MSRVEETFDAAVEAYVDAVGDPIAFNGKPLNAVFGNGWRLVESGDVRLSSRRPEIEVRFRDMPPDACARQDPPEGGDEVEVRGTRFEVVTVKTDVEVVSAKLILKRCDGE